MVQGRSCERFPAVCRERAGAPPSGRPAARWRSSPRSANCCEETPFADLSVSAISDRAGVARSGFYFYFDSKYAVLAQILGEATEELEELTHYFAPREADETPAAFAKRMVGSAAVMFAHNDPVMSACTVARATDAEIRASWTTRSARSSTRSSGSSRTRWRRAPRSRSATTSRC